MRRIARQPGLRQFVVPPREHPGGRAALPLLFTLMLLLGAVLPFAGGTVVAQTASAAVPTVTLDGPITPALANRVSGAIERAGAVHAPAIILEVQSSTATLAATDTIRRAVTDSRVPVLTWVPPGATVEGPGAIIVLTGQVAAMAPDSRIAVAGSYAHTANPLDDDLPHSDWTSDVAGLAERRDRPTDWIATAVAQDTMFPDADAIATGIVDLPAASPASLLAAVDGRTVDLAGGPATIATGAAAVESSEPTFPERLWLFVTLPTVAYLLLCFGAIGLLLEISSPGVTLPGVTGLIALVSAALLLGGMPLSWTGLLLIAGGLTLLIVDVFVPSLGLLTVGGLAAFVVGSHVLFEGGGDGYRVSPAAIWIVTICLTLFFVFLAGSALKALRRRPYSGRESMVGRLGEARTPLAPEGMVFIDGETWQAHAMTLHRTAAAPIIPAGAEVIVTRIDGLLLEVRVATSDELKHLLPSAPGPDRRAVVPVQGESAVD